MDETMTPRQRLLSCLRRVFHRFESERTDDRATWTFTVRVTEDQLDGGWVAECLDLPGCFSQGETKEEALYNLSDAVASVISLRLEQGLPTSPGKVSDGAEILRIPVAS